MEYADVLKNAKEKIGPQCKVCPVCDGRACGNRTPGPGSKPPGNGANDNFNAWRRIKLNMDAVVADAPVETATEFLGRKFAFPLLCAPIGSLKLQYNPTDDVRDFNEKCLAACESRGIAHCFSDGLEDSVFEAGINAAKTFGGAGFPIFNPVADDEILRKIDRWRDAFGPDGAPFATGIVVDGAGLPFLRKLGGNAGTKSVEQLRKFADRAGTPFVVKGIMTAKSAKKAVDAGADAIIVSNHGGRVLADTPATAEVLPEIVAEVGGKTKIVVDGGIRTGLDIFKALALGADMTMICRPVLISYYGGGREGLEAYFDKLKAELADTMYMCGARKISDISSETIRF